MITRGIISLYHKTKGKEPYWTKYTIGDVWYFGGHGSSLNKGISEANDLQVRIPYSLISIDLIDIGDLIIIGEGINISKTSELEDYYTITSINDNNFGNNPHIHIGAK